MALSIAKAGWLYRQSSILKRWKHNWFVLYQNGDLAFFESQDSLQYEERFFISRDCVAIKTGVKCNFNPPENGSKESLLMVELRDNIELRLCAETPDDMRAWQIAIEEARVLRPHTSPPPAYHGGDFLGRTMYPYPGQIFYGPHAPPYVVNSASGSDQRVIIPQDPNNPNSTQIVYVQDYPHYYRGYDGTDVALGMMAGAALGTMMWGPLLWW
ncbi:hypothetical protein ACJMK2_018348 [Sinanodonta woodiana]|uniref:PH domain-containing protein n=1 Tax=Sinanodonta woodiana TaxID=1069815 RepID=A0ABD3UD79_SINWO